MSFCCCNDHALLVCQCGPGFGHGTNGTFVARAYISSCWTNPEYPKSAVRWDGMVVSFSTRSRVRAAMLVAVGLGSSKGRIPIASFASSKVTKGCDILAVAALYGSALLQGSGVS